jgi:chromate transport protein ChrA
VLGPPMIDALVLSLSNIVICLVAAALYVAVNELEPNRRLASALRIVIVAVAVAAILGHLMR